MALSRLTDRVGQVLSDRYRILAPIGTGASASVYLADDVTLRRRVAVKILHAALAEDEAFLRRFRAEARAAAALNHPNVMAVYDWGHDDVPFLVTEYLGGGSLRTVLDQGRLLSPAQALLVGLEASRGLDYAHRRGFVHRDIKPANLLFDEEARLRIADFGLARALAEAAWTEPHGAVLGTARYASPEQARGETLDGRSDVYSLALVMIEAVTGQVPFSADTTIGTLMARVDRPVDVPVSLGALRAPLLAAGVTRPDDRPDASQFTRMLLIAAEQLDRPEPLVLAGAAVHDHDVVPDRDPTVMRRADPTPGSEPDLLSAPPGTVIDGIRVIPDPGDDLPPGATVPLTRLVPDGDGDDHLVGGAEPTPRRRRRWRVVTLSLLLVAALVVAAGVWWFDVRVPTHTVPNLVKTNVATLEQKIGPDHWVVQRTSVSRDGTVRGQILAQSPAAGTHLKENGVLALTVSTGPPPVPVPQDLAGRTLVAARSELQADELTLGAVTYRYDEDKAAGVVLSLAPGVPSRLPKGSKVPVVVSKGAKPRTVPSIAVGTPVATATSTLEALGLHVSTKPQSSETVPSGQVLGSTPTPGTQIPKGATVELIVSSGPPTVRIPRDILGKSVTAAAAELQSLGLSVSGTHGSPLGKVKGTDPGVGTTVRKGTSIVLITR
jgi:eukaryotic-like serine/threonine-protein kinase